ncbi:hypothetical protein NDU88_006759 [Pleurodeles waltl]|uniref:Uncharacterized protein n=1 Tax=Pleurodeles waltl TaxID=8319 RepID=A0AAV7SQL5_PLEWA|nr:hypothetical protein NDU88_006759 [Pleurodeles waltl]
MFFPDYTIAVQKQRNTFLEVKRRLHKMGFNYSLLFPANLHVVADNTTHFFNTPEEAWHWIEGSIVRTTRSAQLEKTREDSSQRNRRGQCRLKPQIDRDFSAVPDLEQRIQERRYALE